MKKVAIYARISTSDKGQDLETQLLPLKDFVTARGWIIHEIYTDTMSGAKESRPSLDRLMQDARRRKVDVVLVYRFDRFARSTRQLINTLELFSSLGIDFISYQEAVDTSTPAGKAMFTLISAFAELERSIIVERVRSGLDRARAQGKQLGRPKAMVDKKLVTELRDRGFSIRAIAKKVGISKSVIQKVIASYPILSLIAVSTISFN